VTLLKGVTNLQVAHTRNLLVAKGRVTAGNIATTTQTQHMATSSLLTLSFAQLLEKKEFGLRVLNSSSTQ